jgi:hypothetical protein
MEDLERMGHIASSSALVVLFWRKHKHDSEKQKL